MKWRCYLQIGNPHCRDNSKHHKEHASNHGGGYAGKHRPDFPEDATQEHSAGTSNDHHATPYLGQEEAEAVMHWPAQRNSRHQRQSVRQGLYLWLKHSMAHSVTGRDATTGKLSCSYCMGSISICILVNVYLEMHSESNHRSTPVYLVLCLFLLL